MRLDKDGNIPLPLALSALTIIIAVLICGLFLLYLVSSVGNVSPSYNAPSASEKVILTKERATSVKRSTPSIRRTATSSRRSVTNVTLIAHVETPMWDEPSDIYLSFEVAGEEISADYEYQTYSDCRAGMCNWTFGPFKMDRGSRVYLTVYNNSKVGCEILVNDERLDAATSYGSTARCSGTVPR